eukprot:11729320-Alexandrium_andersonii.AAC.1
MCIRDSRAQAQAVVAFPALHLELGCATSFAVALLQSRVVAVFLKGMSALLTHRSPFGSRCGAADHPQPPREGK